MDLDVGAELHSFREEVRARVAESAPSCADGPGHPAWAEWERRLGESLVGPSVIVHGTEEQRARLLPRIVDGRDRHCLGFSEPGHGSDLAGVETRGELAGDELAVTGRKVWISGADRASHVLVLCRTEPDAPPHRGLSTVLLRLRDRGVEVRPLRQMSGATGFFEVSLEAARAPLADVVGGLGGGWRVAMTTLAFERGGRAAVAHLAHERELWELIEATRRSGRSSDPFVRQQLAWAYAQVQLMRIQGMRMLAQLAVKREPGPEASVATLFRSEYHRRFGEVAVDLMGADSMVRPDGDGYATDRWQHVFLSSRAETISSGTSDIQRDIIAERALGLPREERKTSFPLTDPPGHLPREGGGEGKTSFPPTDPSGHLPREGGGISETEVIGGTARR
jgi:alkylation response protein AidB-like acyl-CoA dehydrogenase